MHGGANEEPAIRLNRVVWERTSDGHSHPSDQTIDPAAARTVRRAGDSAALRQLEHHPEPGIRGALAVSRRWRRNLRQAAAFENRSGRRHLSMGPGAAIRRRTGDREY